MAGGFYWYLYPRSEPCPGERQAQRDFRLAARPYPELARNVQPGGRLYELAKSEDKRIVFYGAVGDRSTMAVRRRRTRAFSAPAAGSMRKASAPVGRLQRRKRPQIPTVNSRKEHF